MPKTDLSPGAAARWSRTPPACPGPWWWCEQWGGPWAVATVIRHATTNTNGGRASECFVRFDKTATWTPHEARDFVPVGRIGGFWAHALPPAFGPEPPAAPSPAATTAAPAKFRDYTPGEFGERVYAVIASATAPLTARDVASLADDGGPRLAGRVAYHLRELRAAGRIERRPDVKVKGRARPVPTWALPAKTEGQP